MYIIEQKSTTIRSYQFNFKSIKILVQHFSSRVLKNMNILLLLAIVYVISRTFSPNRSNSILVTFTLLTDQVPKIVKWGILGLLGKSSYTYTKK